MAAWADLEDRVRTTASRIWNAPCNPGRLSGVNVDGVIDLGPDSKILIEITENDRLNKVREDTTKLAAARLPFFMKGISALSYIVIDGDITPAMRSHAEESHIKIFTVEQFQRLFFDFSRYADQRRHQPFGSVLNPLSGDIDHTDYVQVSYVTEDYGKEISIKEIADYLKAGRHIVLIGEYGSGKSRCVKELFRHLSETAEKTQDYPIAINLRECWGLKRAGEIVRRHFTDLGLDDIQAGAIKASLSGATILLLDGFDELGSQSWVTDDRRLKSIRVLAMEGVADSISKAQSGVLVSGREHYFSSQSEMLDALGVDKTRVLVVRAKSEFTEEEMQRYFLQRGIDPAVPNWLPRRPLICQTVINLDDDQIQDMFGLSGNEAAFWDHFIRVVAARDAMINARFQPEVVLQVMIALSRITRAKPMNVGPITLDDMQRAFEIAIGRAPVEDASVMLQRLPALGRVGSESADRQFIDVAILDTLRARDIAQITRADSESFAVVSAETWTNPLGDLGQRILAQTPTTSRAEVQQTLDRAVSRVNRTLASDLAAGLMRGAGPAQDFRSVEITDGNFDVLEMSDRKIQNLTIKESIIHSVAIPTIEPENVRVSASVIGRVKGASAPGGLPSWMAGNHIEHFDSAKNVAEIRRIGLSSNQEVLISIVKKTFFQPGAGRQEDALLRGLSLIARQGKVRAVLNVLLREGVLTKFKGKEGWVYAPERSHAGRMKKLVDELHRSDDPLWAEVSEL